MSAYSELKASLNARRREIEAVQPPATPQEPEPYGPFFDPCGKCVTRTHCAHHDRCLAECVPADLRASTPSPEGQTWQLSADDVEWVVNDNAELGVKIGNQFFFCYKGHSLVYADGTHDDGRPMMWRRVFKREFGECIHPVNYRQPTHIGTVSLDDSDEWTPLPSPPTPEGTQP